MGSRVFAVESQEGKTPAGMNLLLSSALLSAVVWSSWALPDPEQRQARQYMVPYTSQHHIVPYAPNPFFRYQPTAPLTPYAYGTHGLPYLSASQGYQPRQGFVYANEDDKGRFLGSFGGATLAAVANAGANVGALTGSVHITQSIFIPNNQAVATIILDGGFMNNAVYMVWIGRTALASATINNNQPFPLQANTAPTINNQGEVLGAYRVNSGIIPVVKLTAASRFHNIDGNGMSVAGNYIASPGQFSTGAIPANSNANIASQNMVRMSGQSICVYEFTNTGCNMPLQQTCAVARAGCGRIG